MVKFIKTVFVIFINFLIVGISFILITCSAILLISYVCEPENYYLQSYGKFYIYQPDGVQLVPAGQATVNDLVRNKGSKVIEWFANPIPITDDDIDSIRLKLPNWLKEYYPNEKVDIDQLSNAELRNKIRYKSNMKGNKNGYGDIYHLKLKGNENIINVYIYNSAELRIKGGTGQYAVNDLVREKGYKIIGWFTMHNPNPIPITDGDIDSIRLKLPIWLNEYYPNSVIDIGKLSNVELRNKIRYKFTMNGYKVSEGDIYQLKLNDGGNRINVYLPKYRSRSSTEDKLYYPFFDLDNGPIDITNERGILCYFPPDPNDALESVSFLYRPRLYEVILFVTGILSILYFLIFIKSITKGRREINKRMFISSINLLVGSGSFILIAFLTTILLPYIIKPEYYYLKDYSSYNHFVTYEVSELVKNEGHDIIGQYTMYNPNPIPITDNDIDSIRVKLPKWLEEHYPNEKIDVDKISNSELRNGIRYKFSMIGYKVPKGDIYQLRLNGSENRINVYLPKYIPMESDQWRLTENPDRMLVDFPKYQPTESGKDNDQDISKLYYPFFDLDNKLPNITNERRVLYYYDTDTHHLEGEIQFIRGPRLYEVILIVTGMFSILYFLVFIRRKLREKIKFNIGEEDSMSDKIKTEN